MPAHILYEVVITTDPSVRADYLAWLRLHMEEMLEFDGFLSAEMFVDSENGDEFTCHYRLRDMAAMEAYLAGPAKEMRADGVRRFGDKISARRRILTAQD